MPVLHTLLVTGVGTSAEFVSPQAAHTVLQRASQQSALGLIAPRRSLLPMPEGERISLSPCSRGARDGPCS
jgi:hypothetical protein